MNIPQPAQYASGTFPSHFPRRPFPLPRAAGSACLPVAGGRPRTVVGNTVALVLSLLLGLAGATPAAAGPVSGGWHHGAGVAGSAYFVGQHRNTDGLIAYCTDVERFSPDRASGYEDARTGNFVRSNGSALSTADNAALALVLGRWGATTDDHEAAAVQLAVWSLTAVGMEWDSPGMTDFIRAQALSPGLATRARAMVEQARAEAGPYSITAAYTPDRTGGRVEAIVKSSDGTTRPGVAVEALAEGATLVGGSTSASWTSQASPHVLGLQRTGFGAGRITITAPSVPAPHAVWLTPREHDVQRLVVAPLPARTEVSIDLPSSDPFAPEVTTSTSATTTAPGSAVHDVLEVSVAAPKPWLVDPATGKPVELEVVSTLWGPLTSAPTETGSVPSGTPFLGTVTTTVSGKGRYETPSITVPAAGYYVWTESIDPGSARPAEASPYVAPWSGSFGLPLETTLVPWRPSVSTKLSQVSALPGAVVHDTVTATGFNPADDGGVVGLTMYGPLAGAPAESSDVPEGAPIHSHVDVPARDGTARSSDFAPLGEPGCYTVVATFSGSSNEEAFTSAFGIPAETVCIEAPPAPAAEPPDDQPAPALSAPAHAPAMPEAASASDELARTGVSAGAMTGCALIALGLGLGLRTAVRRRAVR